ncbi:MAG: hypothetical protein OSJ37_10595 [Muribaculaceae bacterium]|jgi:phosphoribosyl-AMP cyclohydrolase|nr:hypothetical protein [Muribaculaceae bacterium]
MQTGRRAAPGIVPDSATLKVLLLGYMNREAFDKAVAERKDM